MRCLKIINPKKNKHLNKAQNHINDEFYTKEEYIDKEVSHYIEQLEGKSILCNCNDRFESAFTQYFIKHFREYKLKQLVCISYSQYNPAKSYAIIINRDNPPSIPDIEIEGLNELTEQYGVNAHVKKLQGSGAFQSEEAIEYLRQCDIVITNPPFSKYTEYFKIIDRYNKKFLLVSKLLKFSPNYIFNAVMNNRIQTGYTYGKTHFIRPTIHNLSNQKKEYYEFELDNILWFTNLDKPSTPEYELILTERYSPDKYPKYDNSECIYVDKVKHIPKDYSGLMGVPITFMQYYDPDKYEILGKTDDHGVREKNNVLFKAVVNNQINFMHLVIRNKYPEPPQEDEVLSENPINCLS